VLCCARCLVAHYCSTGAWSTEVAHPCCTRGPNSRCAVLCCAVLCCAVLCCAVLAPPHKEKGGVYRREGKTALERWGGDTLTGSTASGKVGDVCKRRPIHPPASQALTDSAASPQKKTGRVQGAAHPPTCFTNRAFFCSLVFMSTSATILVTSHSSMHAWMCRMLL